MTEIVVVYEDSDEYYYKPMTDTSITQDVKDELNTYKDKDYCIARSGTLTILNDEEENPYEPNEDGFYTKDQCNYTIDEDGDFVKQEIDIEGVKGDWINFKTGETITIP